MVSEQNTLGSDVQPTYDHMLSIVRLESSAHGDALLPIFKTKANWQ